MLSYHHLSPIRPAYSPRRTDAPPGGVICATYRMQQTRPIVTQRPPPPDARRSSRAPRQSRGLQCCCLCTVPGFTASTRETLLFIRGCPTDGPAVPLSGLSVCQVGIPGPCWVWIMDSLPRLVLRVEIRRAGTKRHWLCNDRLAVVMGNQSA